MKTQLTLLAFCLCGVGIASAQTTTNTYSSSSTNSTYSTSPTTSDSTKSMSNNTTTPMSMSDNSGSTMSTGSTNSSNNTYSTNSAATSTDGTTTTYSTNNQPTDVKKTKDYKNFVFGIYAGLNTTKFKGETTNTSGNLSGRLGYQAGFFVRGGGRLYGQIGAEYFASSSNYFTAGTGQTVASIQSKIDIQYVQVPVYIGYKLVQSERGISAVRVQVGVEYANRINSNSGDFKLTNSEIKSGTFNGLGQLGFDAGPIFLDLTYHYGFDNSINAINSTGFAGSQRRILSASVGFKF